MSCSFQKKTNPKSSQPYILFWCSSFPVTEIRRTPDEVPFWVDDCLVRRAPREESGELIIKGFYFDNACSLSCSIVISLALHNCHSMFSRPLCGVCHAILPQGHQGTLEGLSACFSGSCAKDTLIQELCTRGYAWNMHLSSLFLKPNISTKFLLETSFSVHSYKD